VIGISSTEEQKGFDLAYRGVLWQGGPSLGKINHRSPINHSLYRHPTMKCKCTVGWLLSSNDYSFRYEGRAIGEILMSPDRPRSLLSYSIGFLEDLQWAHDNSVLASKEEGVNFIDEFKYRMGGVSQKYGLEIPIYSETKEASASGRLDEES
jgi:hypothetical protein